MFKRRFPQLPRIFRVSLVIYSLFFFFPSIVAAEILPVQSWVSVYNGGAGSAQKMVTDPIGNIYVSGTMKDSLGVYGYVTIKYDTSGIQLWVARYAGGGGYTGRVALSVDSSGNVYVAGHTYDPISYSYKNVIIKYDTNGNQLWVSRYGSSNYNSISAMKVDDVGNVYVTGEFYNYSSRPSLYDYVTIKYDTNGNQIWDRRYNSAGGYSVPPTLAVDSSGNVYVAGHSFNAVGPSHYDYVLIKYDTNGNQVWITKYNSGMYNDARDVFVDKSGSIYITGNSYNESNFSNDYVTIKYDTSGNQLWVKSYDNGGGESVKKLVVDSLGNVYVTGVSSFNATNTKYGYATVKYDTKGNQLWVARNDDGWYNSAEDITTDISGNVYVTGVSSFNTTNTNYGSVTIKYGVNGGQLWSVNYGGKYAPRSILVDVHGYIYITGGTGSNYLTVKYTPVDSPVNFWSQLQNSPQGWFNLRKAPGIQNKPADDIIKTVPTDWVLKVATTTDATGKSYEFDGFQWYGVVDATDGAVGWMTAKNIINGTEYLSYEASTQALLEAKATTTLTKEARIPVILQAVDNYYIQPNISNSLYGGGGGVGNKNNFQTFIQESAFPKELVLAIAAQESGSVGFNNEIVTFDYGHGIMQSTLAASIDISKNGWDNRGVGSDVTIPLCKSIFSNDYKKCYANSETPNNLRKPYQHYDGNPANPLYKQYANTFQSIYANVKDGFRVIQDKHRKKCPKADMMIGGYTFTCQDIEKILTVWGYNGFGKDRNTGLYTGAYLKDVAGKLENLDSYFPGIAYTNTDFIQKMKIANAHKQIIKVYSPVTFNVVDSVGRITGLSNNSLIEEIPNSLYERNAEGVALFFPSDTYQYRVIGTTIGTYGLSVDDTNGDVARSFHAIDIPTTLGEIHEYLIDWEALDRGERGVTVRIDTNGDGVIDRVVQSDGVLTEIVPPTVTIVSPAGEYLFNTTTTVQFTTTDASGIATTRATLNGVSVTNGQVVTLTKPGTNIIEVSAMDNEGNSATETSTFRVTYATSGFLPPIKTDGSGIYNQGRALPVKFSLFDANNNPVSQVIAHIYVVKISNDIVGNDEIPLPTSAANIGNQFRYDSSGKLHIFNLSMGTMSPGVWQIKAVLDSGQVIMTVVSIK